MKTYPITLAPEPPVDTISGDEVQAWVDMLGERESAALRTLMEHCVMQGRKEALADAIDSVARMQRSMKEHKGALKLLDGVLSMLGKARLATLEQMRDRGFG